MYRGTAPNAARLTPHSVSRPTQLKLKREPNSTKLFFEYTSDVHTKRLFVFVFQGGIFGGGGLDLAILDQADLELKLSSSVSQGLRLKVCATMSSLRVF